MNRNTRCAITVLFAAMIIAALGALLVWADSTQDRISAQGSTVESIVRGGYSGWSRFDRLDTWYEETAVRAEVQNRDPSLLENTPGELARFTIHRGKRLCAEYDCDNWPTGTITQSLTIDGRQAVKYVLPAYDPGNGLAGEVYIDIDEPANSVYPDLTFLEMIIREAEDQQEYDSLLTDLEAIVASYVFVDDYVDISGWDETFVSSPQVLALDELAILHPSNMTVTETPSQVVVSTFGPATGVTVTFEPGRPQSDWDNAVNIFGVGGVRLLGTQVAGGVRVTEYTMDYAPHFPIKATAAIADDPVGSPSYWNHDQTVWAIMSNAYFAYSPALLDPYP